MISTLQIKQQQLVNGFFQTGTGDTIILIMGSCRVAPIVGYFEKWNEENGNIYTILTIDPFSWNWDINENRVDYEAELLKQESNQTLLSALSNVEVFVHEWYQNAGMFNCNKESPKNIYQYGLNPKIDACIPSWNDVFVLFADIVSFDSNIRKKAIQDYNVIGKLSEETQQEIFQLSQNNLNKFYDVCLKSDFHEMKEYFQRNITGKRMFFTYNHVSKEFTYFIFVRLLKRFLGIDLSEGFIRNIYQQPDMFANNYTYLTEYDIKWYNYQWNENLVDLKHKLF
jgi:hypothetical protein